MGLLWDLVQQSQIRKQREQATSLESRLEAIEKESAYTRELLNTLIVRLENHFEEDINGDGRVG